MAFGRRVRAARLALAQAEHTSISQTALAARAGIRQQDVSNIESGKKASVEFSDVLALAGVFGADVHEWFTGEPRLPISKLASDINKLTLDHWGDSTVLEVAQREAARYAAQHAAEIPTVDLRDLDEAERRAVLAGPLATQAEAADTIRRLHGIDRAETTGDLEERRLRQGLGRARRHG